MTETIGNISGIAAFAGTAGQLKVGSISEEAFILGKSFSYEDYTLFALADEEHFIVFNPVLYAGFFLFFDPIALSASSGPVLVDIYAGTDSDEDGTLLGASNRRAAFPGPKSTLRMDPTINDIGTRFAGDMVPATGNNPNTANGSSNSGGLPFEPIRPGKTAIKFTNLDGADTYLQIKLTWYEL